MSFFLGNTAQYSNVEVNPEKVKLAEVQFTVMSSTFNKMLSTCQEKCIGHEYGEGDVNTGEASCTDRCVSKYVKANAMIAQEVQSKLLPNEMPEYKKIQSMMADKQI
ncbi:hypothetical protein METBIDRAFT_34614 [Metschnikowia bicuspidata var. bicuspidata NRRL YB-4993]|uniref:Mitochondrial import inner membrane translocase subunit n=1 Tax=Metschnikowia bicuspidata var. bicuspidata NRRL YB-4993 TaxID=869754 RepID=A0A1A0HG24_9ASCO|nr:hypothetical protein METBIDRAFT_34614 [Metschnikowia bicuspidata var. bicuspidata NRRL YB-4993]OBA22935.1 hypothetical protein METBIDRAFT_34614 [Metschnikowia bicuspidata var. bicuspidata NRRL YB-4993]